MKLIAREAVALHKKCVGEIRCIWEISYLSWFEDGDCDSLNVHYMTLPVSLIARLLKVRAECIRREKSGQMFGETAGDACKAAYCQIEFAKLMD